MRHGYAPALEHSSGRPVLTLPEAFQETIGLRPDAVALRTVGGTREITWAEYACRVERVAAGLAALGVRHGDTIGIMLTNRPEFHVVDTAALHIGAVPFSIYNTSSPQQISYLFGNAENWVVITERAFLDRIKQAGVAYDYLVCVDDPGGDLGTAVPLHEVENSPAAYFDFVAAWTAVRPHDLATLIYTSGTTGPPKGVELTHANIISQLDGLHPFVPVGIHDRVLSYLPAAHIADRISSHYANLARGMQITSVPSPADLPEALQDVRPTVFFGVPRVWHKLRAGVEGTLLDEPSRAKRKMARWAIDAGLRAARAELTGGRRGVRGRLADGLVLPKVRRALGMDQVRFAASGAAAAPPELLTYFYGLGVRITEVWGMSEATGTTTTTTVDNPRLGTVGKPLPSMEVALGPDGELFVRGPMVMRRYRGNPALTAAAIDAEGWLATGDIGTLDGDGNITIIDRKKEMIILESGKNLAPTNVENAILATSPLIGNVVALGEGMPYVTALVMLDPDAVQAQANALRVEAAELAELISRPGIRDHLAAAIRAGNATLSRPEQIKRFALLPSVWEPGGDELTHTLKLRRRPIADKYHGLIAALYADPPGPDVIDLG